MGNTPKTEMAKAAAKVFDLDAAIAESEHEPFKFRYAGRDWSMPHMNDLNVWPLVEKVEHGDLASAITIFETALGDSWPDFHALPMTRSGMQTLFDQYLKHSGVEPGESPASIN